MRLYYVFICVAISSVEAKASANFAPGRTAIAMLFEWPWRSVADECERFLGPKGFGAVQVSPPNEHLVIEGRPWWERWQPMSYKIATRSGTEEEFEDMCRRCNEAGVRIYVDTLLNHMTAEWPNNVGTAGSTAVFDQWLYLGVPYNKNHFNSPVCDIGDSKEPEVVRNCQLYELKDLNQTNPYVRDQLVGYMNKLIDLGVAGLSIDSANHMWPKDLEAIYDRLKDLNTDHGFEPGTKPFIYQDVISLGDDPIKREEYIGLGAVTEHQYGFRISQVYTSGKLNSLKNWGPEWGFLEDNAVVFIDEQHDQRGQGVGGNVTLYYLHRRGYKAAAAFMLAHPYGLPRLMSSFNITQSNLDASPPMDADENILPPVINEDGSCSGGWVCEHRWRQIYSMVEFRNVVEGTEITNWWDNGGNQIAFCRGDRGFIALNNEALNMNKTIQTCLPQGDYCDVITGYQNGTSCTGKTVRVDSDGFADIEIEGYLVYREAVLAIHVNSKLN